MRTLLSRVILARVILARVVLGAVLSLVLTTACGYDPKPESGTLLCGPGGSCPEGYGCMSSYCYKGGGGACSGGTTATQKLIGHWTFVAPSRRFINCSDGSSDDDTMWSDFFDIDIGFNAPLATFYYCDFDLDVGPTGSTVLRSGSSCTAPDSTDPTVIYTWTGQTFTLTTSDGCSGTLTASIPFDAATLTGTVSCTMDFTGTVTKS